MLPSQRMALLGFFVALSFILSIACFLLAVENKKLHGEIYEMEKRALTLSGAGGNP